VLPALAAAGLVVLAGVAALPRIQPAIWPRWWWPRTI